MLGLRVENGRGEPKCDGRDRGSQRNKVIISPEVGYLIFGGGALYLCYRAGVFLVREVRWIETRGARILVGVSLVLGMLLLLGFAAGMFYMCYLLSEVIS